MLFQVQLQLLKAIVLPCPCGYVISGSVAIVDSHCITLPLWLCYFRFSCRCWKPLYYPVPVVISFQVQLQLLTAIVLPCPCGYVISGSVAVVDSHCITLSLWLCYFRFSCSCWQPLYYPVPVVISFQVQLQLLTAIVLPCPCGYVISGSVAIVDSHCITLPCGYIISGSVAVVDSHCITLSLWLCYVRFSCSCWQPLYYPVPVVMLCQVQLQLLTAIVLPCPCGYVISGSVAIVDSHCITLPLWLCYFRFSCNCWQPLYYPVPVVMLFQVQLQLLTAIV